MGSRLLLVTALATAACSFPSGGVPLGGDAGGDAAPAIDGPPPDACVPATETCNGLDDDCDDAIDEGLTSGAACDGPDADECEDDQIVCDASGAEVCGDTSGDDDAELCNAADDDCDGDTDEGFALGVACDGADGDLCAEGVSVCSGDGLGLACSDATGTIVETCDLEDEDCDEQIDETFDLDNDVDNCGECGTQCTNALGTTSCAMGTCQPVCDNGAANCDSDVINGCEPQNTDPACPPQPLPPDPMAVHASVRGDQGSDVVVVTGTTERWLRVRVVESNGGVDTNLRALLQLVSGPGTDFDLEVLCADVSPNCGTTPPMTSVDDTLVVGRSDLPATTRTFEVFALVRYDPSTPSTTCAQWSLTVSGNIGTVPAELCAD